MVGSMIVPRRLGRSAFRQRGELSGVGEHRPEMIAGRREVAQREDVLLTLWMPVK
jgi:hypothetical protein